MVDNNLWETLTASQLAFPFITNPQVLPVQEKNGVVYTKPWVVELILDLAGYTEDADLVDCFAIEPAAGNGAFLIPMAQRLVTSCKRQNTGFVFPHYADTASISLFIFLTSPCKTFPGPTSIKFVAPSVIIC